MDTVSRIVEIFRRRGYAIPPATAAECWRQYSYDCEETIGYVDLPPDDERTYAVVAAYYPGVLAGMTDKDAAEIKPLATRMGEDEVARLRGLAAKLTGLLDDPHPGLSGWQGAVAYIRGEIATPPGPATDEVLAWDGGLIQEARDGAGPLAGVRAFGQLKVFVRVTDVP